MKAFILTLLITVGVFAQGNYNFQEFEKQSDHSVVYYDTYNIKRKADTVTFYGKLWVNDTTWVITGFAADCKSRKYAIIAHQGEYHGAPFVQVEREIVIIESHPEGIMRRLIDKVCGNKSKSAFTDG